MHTPGNWDRLFLSLRFHRSLAIHTRPTVSDLSVHESSLRPIVLLVQTGDHITRQIEAPPHHQNWLHHPASKSSSSSPSLSKKKVASGKRPRNQGSLPTDQSPPPSCGVDEAGVRRAPLEEHDQQHIISIAHHERRNQFSRTSTATPFLPSIFSFLFLFVCDCFRRDNMCCGPL